MYPARQMTCRMDIILPTDVGANTAWVLVSFNLLKMPWVSSRVAALDAVARFLSIPQRA